MGLPMTTETSRKSSTLLGHNTPPVARFPVSVWGSDSLRLVEDLRWSLCSGCPWEINCRGCLVGAGMAMFFFVSGLVCLFVCFEDTVSSKC